MKGIIESIRSLLKFVLLFFEIVIGALIAYHLVYAVILSTWTEFFILYFFFVILTFVGYCLGRVIAIGKDIKFMSMLKGLIIAPLFFIYLVYKQIRSPYILESKGNSGSKTAQQVPHQDVVSNNEPIDNRKKDWFKGELQSQLNRVEVDVYSVSNQHNHIKVKLCTRPQATYMGFNKIEIRGADLDIIVDCYEDGEFYGNIDVKSWAEDVAKEMNDSLVSQVEDILERMQSKYKGFDDKFGINIGTIYTIKKDCHIKRQTY